MTEGLPLSNKIFINIANTAQSLFKPFPRDQLATKEQSFPRKSPNAASPMIARHTRDFTWNRGCSSNYPPLTHGDQIPHPLEDSDNQIPSSQILSPLPPILFVHSLSLWSLYALIASNENKNNKTNKKTNRQTKTKTKIRTITWMLHDQPLSLRLDACYAILSNDSCSLQMFILSLRENLTYLAFPCSATHLLRLFSMLRSLGLVLIWWHQLRSTFQLVCPDDDIGGDSVYWQDFPCLGTQFLFLHFYLWPLVRKHVPWNILWNSQWKDRAHQTLSSLWVKACAASSRKIFPAVENPNLEQRF